MCLFFCGKGFCDKGGEAALLIKPIGGNLAVAVEDESVCLCPDRFPAIGKDGINDLSNCTTQVFNEFCVKPTATDLSLEALREPAKFTPIFLAPFEDKYMSVLVQ